MPSLSRHISNNLSVIPVTTLAESARSLGANTCQIMLKSILPRIVTGILCGCLLVIASVFAGFSLANLNTGAKSRPSRCFWSSSPARTAEMLSFSL